jgi:hypothetical protein
MVVVVIELEERVVGIVMRGKQGVVVEEDFKALVEGIIALGQGMGDGGGEGGDR